MAISQTVFSSPPSPRSSIGSRLSMWPIRLPVDAVAHQAPQARREARGDLARDAELLVLLLADEAGAVVHGDADAPLAGAVGAAAVPEAAVPDQHAARLHLRRDAVVVAAEVGRAVRLVAAGNEAGGAVLLGEVGERPHGVADDRAMGLVEGDQLVVGVDGLRRLAGADADRGERGDQAAVVEHALDDRQHVRVHRDPLVERAVHQQVVDAPGAGAPRSRSAPGRCRAPAPGAAGPPGARRRGRARSRPRRSRTRPARSGPASFSSSRPDPLLKCQLPGASRTPGFRMPAGSRARLAASRARAKSSGRSRS